MTVSTNATRVDMSAIASACGVSDNRETYRKQQLPRILSNPQSNAKTVKGEKVGYLTGIVYLAPGNMSGFEVCPQRTNGCSLSCLGHNAGRVTVTGQRNGIIASRVNKTRWFYNERDDFMATLASDIARLVRSAKRRGMVPCVRLNGTSDIPYERIRVSTFANIMAMFPNVQFYDYTKIYKRAIAHARGEMPENYHLTYSATGENDDECARILAAGGNVSMVFRHTLPERFGYYRVINADKDDLRFLDGRGVIAGLVAKGAAKRDATGFVRD